MPIERNHDAAGAPVGRVGLALDEPGPLDVVEQVGHDGPVDAELLGEGQLGALPSDGGGGEHLINARPARHVAHHGVGDLHVGAEHHAQRPPQIGIDRNVIGGTGVRDIAWRCRCRHGGHAPMIGVTEETCRADNLSDRLSARQRSTFFLEFL